MDCSGAIHVTAIESPSADSGAAGPRHPVQCGDQYHVPSPSQPSARCPDVGSAGAGADSGSNNLVEADNASSDADFLHKMRTALREMREAEVCLRKLRLSKLADYEKTEALEREAGELAAIFASIVVKVARRLERQEKRRTRRRT